MPKFIVLVRLLVTSCSWISSPLSEVESNILLLELVTYLLLMFADFLGSLSLVISPEFKKKASTEAFLYTLETIFLYELLNSEVLDWIIVLNAAPLGPGRAIALLIIVAFLFLVISR